MRKLIFSSALLLLLGLGGVIVAQYAVSPRVIRYTSDRQHVDYAKTEAGIEAVQMTWRAVRLRDVHHMMMHAWVNNQWVLIGEGFAPEKTDRIVVSHPLSFERPRYRLAIVDASGQIVHQKFLELDYMTETENPEIAEFNAPVANGIPRDALDGFRVPLQWHINGRGYRQQPVFEQVLPDGEPVPRDVPLTFERWMPRYGENDLILKPVAGQEVFIRLRLVDTATRETVTSAVITLPIVEVVTPPQAPTFVVDDVTHTAMQAVYNRGREQSAGLPTVPLARIGDSNIVEDAVLCNFKRGNYEIGMYTDLLPTIETYADAFCAPSVSAQRALNTFTLNDPTWADNALCEPDETPLDCELRRSQPIAVLIYIGVQDLELIAWDDSIGMVDVRENYQQLLETLLNAGVIPIVATFPTGHAFHADGSAAAINSMIRSLAAEYHVPLIDLRAATATYPNRGTEVDGFHMSTPPDGKTDFTGNQHVYARTLYELQVLQALAWLNTLATAPSPMLEVGAPE